MSKDLPPSRTADQFVVRFPDGMRERIAESAKLNGRSMNSEIVSRLEASFASTGAPEATKDPSGSTAQLQEIAQAHKDTVKWLSQLNHALALSLEDIVSHVPQEMLEPGSAVEKSARMARSLARQAQAAHQEGTDSRA